MSVKLKVLKLAVWGISFNTTREFSRSISAKNNFLATYYKKSCQNCLVRYYGTKIYTKTGDKGTSSLFTGERRPKSDLVFDALGDVDELSSNIGMCREVLKGSWQHENYKEIEDMLEKVQCSLQDVGSCIATPLSSASEKMLERTRFEYDLVNELEEWIDQYTKDLPELKNFILPSGGKSSCALHICRSVCRRAERKIAVLLLNQHVDETVARYMNRLSDLIFTLARYTATMEGQPEVVYKKPRKEFKEVESEVFPVEHKVEPEAKKSELSE